MKFAYIRVSSKDQNEARQLDTMQAQGVDAKNVFIDKASGKDTNRAEYQRMKDKLREGDTVVFDSISRMSRNMDATKKEYAWFIENGISLEFVKEPILNTKVDGTQDVMQRAISDIILTLLATFAEVERNDIRSRQAEGIASAKRRGQRLGRPTIGYSTLSNEQRVLFDEQYRRWKDGKQTAVQAFTNAGLTKSTFYKIVTEYESLAGVGE